MLFMKFVANKTGLWYDKNYKKTGTGGRILADRIISALIVDDEKAAMDATSWRMCLWSTAFSAATSHLLFRSRI